MLRINGKEPRSFGSQVLPVQDNDLSIEELPVQGGDRRAIGRCGVRREAARLTLGMRNADHAELLEAVVRDEDAAVCAVEQLAEQARESRNRWRVQVRLVFRWGCDFLPR